MAEDIIYMHGITNFFPTDYCDGCGLVHSVSIYNKIVNTVYSMETAKTNQN